MLSMRPLRAPVTAGDQPSFRQEEGPVSALVRRLAATLVSSSLGVGLLATGAAAAEQSPSVPVPASDVADSLPVAGDGDAEYLVRFADGTNVRDEARDMRASDVEVDRTFGTAVRGAAVTASPEEITEIAESPQVEAIALDAPVSIDAEWGLDRIDQRSLPLSGSFKAPGSGAGVDVYVIDTGVRSDHTDLGGRVAAGWTAILDGRGTEDCNGHGTHVAGTAAGSAYGVARKATVIPVRVLDCSGSGKMSDVVAGLDWVARQHEAGSPAVVNLSLGGGANTVVDAAVEFVVNDGVTVVVAAGNASADACGASPARVPAALTVGASDILDRQTSFSNYGTCLDVYAPGAGIRSAWHTSPTSSATLSGTSMASPHTAGAAAALLGTDPSLSPARVSAMLTENATVGALTGLSAGSPDRLLFATATAAPAPAPAPAPEPQPEPRRDRVEEEAPATKPVDKARPTPARKLVGRSRSRSVVLTWVRGSADDARITRQTVVVYRFGKRIDAVQVRGRATRTRITGLKPGRGYSFRIIERTRFDKSKFSAPSRRVAVRR
jgi:subtilisin family serine protease